MPSVVQLALSQLLTVETYDQVLTDLLTFAQSLGLNTTAWQKLGITRTTMTTIAQKVADLTNMAVTITQGGFITLADDGPLDAAGNVTPGMVDLCAYNQFNVQRTFAAPATCTVQVTNANTSLFSSGPGGMRFANPTTGATYTSTNTTTFSVPAGTTQPIQIAADIPGTGGSSGVGAISALAVPIAGISCTNSTAAIGVGATPKGTLVASCQAKLASISPRGAPGAYVFFAQNPQLFDGTPTTLNNGNIAQAIGLYNGNGAVRVVVSSTSGPVEGCFQVNVTGASNLAGYAELTLASPTTLLSGDTVTVNGTVTTGGLVINGTWPIIVVDSTHIVLFGTVWMGAWSSGGQVTGGDLGTVAMSVQSNALPLGTTLSVVSASGVAVTPIGTIYTHNATQTTTQILSAAATALASMFASVPIGGYAIGGGNVLPLAKIASTIVDSSGSIVDVVLSAPAADVALTATGVPISGWANLAAFAANMTVVEI